jgi:CRISPR-associated protein Cmr3
MSPAKKKKKSRHSKARRSKVTAKQRQARANAAQAGSGEHGPRLRLSAVDTWFFRESRPHNAVGASELASLFPPPAATLAGALRTAIGDAQGTDWQQFNADPEHPLRSVIGHGDDLGPLAIDGPWLNLDGRPLFPAPAFLLARDNGGNQDYQRLRVGPAADTDLGRVHLPQMPGDARDYKPLEHTWIDADGMRQLLAGRTPDSHQVFGFDDLCSLESRVGIARDRHTRTVEQGMLYQTRHLRPRDGLSIDLALHGLAAEHRPPAGTLVRLGGEGRLATLDSIVAPDPVAAIKPKAAHRGLILLLLTAVDLGGDWLPPGFTAAIDDQDRGPDRGQSWTGQLHGIPLRIRAAVIGRALRQGGWDQAAGRPRPVRSLLPAGSAWYCELTATGQTTDSDLQTAIDTLHGSQLHRHTAATPTPGHDYHHRLGHGRIAVGLWPNNEHPEQETPS